MRVIFWGVRGSITTPELTHARYGGNTPCVALECGDTNIIFDAGMGLRWMTLDLLRRFPERKLSLHLLLTHCHWDHIQGIPFAPVMYLPGHQVTIYGRGNGDGLRKTLLTQMRSDFCPVPNFFLHEDVGADIVIRELSEGEFRVGGAKVICKDLPRGDKPPVAGYRVEWGGRVVTYVTDVEYPGGPGSCRAALELADKADLIVHDGQFLPEEREAHRNWGHSTTGEALELARLAGCRMLAIFHHDPSRDDVELDAIGAALRNSEIRAFPAREGMVIEL